MKNDLPAGVELYGSETLVVAFGGMGQAAATRAVQAAMSAGPISALASVGWAGSCLPGLPVGSVLWPSTVVDVRTGERFTAEHGDGTVVATGSGFAGADLKRRYRDSYNASLVEMEAATVARLARAHEIPFCAAKVVSDGDQFSFPEIERFYTPGGQFRELAFGLFMVSRPRLWRPVAIMARDSKLAAERLSAELLRWIACSQEKE